VLIVGCQRGPQFACVEGVVFLDGKPLPDAEVQFIPDITQQAKGPPASAYTDKDGRYQVLADGNSGVVVGKNRVSINDARIMMSGNGVDAESGISAPAKPARASRNRVPAEYSDALRSPLGVLNIQPGSQTVRLEMKTKP
jgi:hypothetical protein